MNVVPIDDPDDSRIADYRNIPDPELIARRGLFVAEGRLVVARLLQSRWHTRSLLVTETALKSIEPSLQAHPELPVYAVEQRVMNAVTGFNIHRGCLAIGERRPLPAWQQLATTSQLLVVLERLGNADNVGSIFRNASAFHVEAVLLGPSCADPLYRKALRTSMGAVLAVPFAHAEPWPQPLTDLQRQDWTVVALTPSARMTIQEVFTAAPAHRTAIVVGHEGEGLTPEALSACNRHARIPIAEEVDSLNAATAVAVALHEFQR